MKTQSLFFRSASLWLDTGAAAETKTVDETAQRRRACNVSAGNVPVGVRMSESGNSSKLDVSSMLLMMMGMAAGLSLHRTSQRHEDHVNTWTLKPDPDLSSNTFHV